jgi:isopenicillin-N epimerase
MAHNRTLALQARRLVSETIGTKPPCPESMVGSLAVILLPDGVTEGIAWRRPDPIQGRLFDGWGIEVPVMSWPAPPQRHIRVSAQLYNERAHYVRLAEALTRELAAERR